MLYKAFFGMIEDIGALEPAERTIMEEISAENFKDAVKKARKKIYSSASISYAYWLKSVIPVNSCYQPIRKKLSLRERYRRAATP